MAVLSSWRYVGKADPKRIVALQHSRPASQLPEAMRNGLTLVCYHREPGHDQPSYERAVFCAVVNAGLFDWFFNASTGYRGAFYASPGAGVQLNHELINHLTPSLADWALAKQKEHDRTWTLNSLSKASAKAWLAEPPGLCHACSGEWSPSFTADLLIENGRWECSSHVHSAWGRQAPLLSKIRIFGGLVDAENKEWLAAHKTDRATHIWKHGWS